jgi:hypothetical protein
LAVVLRAQLDGRGGWYGEDDDAHAYDLAHEEIIPMLERLLGVLGRPRPSGVI